MPPPSPLSIKTSSVTRLTKEESYYRQETARQQVIVENLKASGADEYELRQPTQVLKETVVMAPEVRKRLDAAVKVLEMALAELEGASTADDVDKANKAIAAGKEVIEKYGLGENS